MDTNEPIAIDGYDTISFFYGKPEKGSEEYSCSHAGKTWLFCNDENRQKFLTHPEQYQPQFEGNCALAMSLGQKIKANPLNFAIIDEHLYFGKNAVASWLFKHLPGGTDRAQHKWEGMSKQTAKDESAVS